MWLILTFTEAQPSQSLDTVALTSLAAVKSDVANVLLQLELELELELAKISVAMSQLRIYIYADLHQYLKESKILGSSIG